MAAVGTCTVTKEHGHRSTIYRLALVTDATGAVSGHPLGLRAGKVVRVAIIPDSGGTAPTNLYDVTLVDGDGIDALSGGGADCLAASSRSVLLDPPYAHVGTLDPVVANGGDSKGVTLVIVIED